MTASNTATRDSRIARLTGLAYLGIIATGIFAELFVRTSLIQTGDAATTASNIASSPNLFRAGLAADATMVALDVAVAIGLYTLLKPVHRPLALLATAFRLVQASVLGANLMNLANALHWALGDAGVAATEPGTARALVLSALELHRVVYDLGLIFFGLACLVLGHLMRVSRLVPPVLGVGLSVAGAVYLLGSFLVVLAPDVASAVQPMYGLTVIAELAVAIWLTVKGVTASATVRPHAAGRCVSLASVALLSLTACGADHDVTDDAQMTQLQESADDDADPSDTSLVEDGERGEHGVGFRVIRQPESGLVVKAWYPTTEPDDAIKYEVSFKADYYGAPTGKISGRAHRGAELADQKEPFPVVVFSHGFSLNPEWYSVLTEHLASQGFVVLAPEHAEGDWDTTVVAATFDRPLKVRQTLDLAEQLHTEGEWEGRLGLARVGIVGHSYGGYTALASAGARLDIEGLARRCGRLDAMDPKAFLCAPFVGDPSAMDRLQTASDEGMPLLDARVGAVVTIAGDAYLFGREGLAFVTVPTLAIGGTGDNYSPWDWGTELTYNSVGSRRAALVGLEGADHMIAVNTCEHMPWTDALPAEFSAALCQDPRWERDAALDVVRRFSTAFLLDTLTGDAAARDRLSSAAVKQSKVRYDASW